MDRLQKFKTIKGFVLGIVAAVSYGTNPLFAVPLYQHGLGVPSVIFYRYTIATLLLGLIMLIKRQSFRLQLREVGLMAVMGVLFALSSVLLFDAYNYMDVGLASTLLFMEPVFIVLILTTVYRERVRAATLASIAVCIVGVVCLCDPGDEAYITTRGVVLVMLSALAYAIYMVAINKTRVRNISGMRITFYSLLFGQIVLTAATGFYSQLQPVPMHSPTALVCVLGISIVPTIVSLLTVAISVKCVGSVTVAILGALEPVTGILVGCLAFSEVLTLRAIIGIVLILSSVIIIIKSHP